MSPALAAFDVGNSAVTIGLFAGTSGQPAGLIRLEAAAPGEPGALDRAWAGLAESETAGPAIIASVNPPVGELVASWCRARLPGPVLTAGREAPIPVVNRARTPEQVGADRLLNALAAYRLAGGAALVVDFGTALTVDVVDESGAYCGGAIAPGLSLGAKALSEHTALLPLLGPAKRGKPDRALGDDTESAINSGLYHGLAGQVRELLRAIKAELPGQPAVFSTGGDRPPGLELEEISQHRPGLTLEGLYLTWVAWRERQDQAPGSA